MAIGFWDLLVIEIVVDLIEFLCLWKISTGGWPWGQSADKRGKYLRIEDYNEETGRFQGAIYFSVNDVLGLADRSIMQQQLRAKDARIEELEKMIKK